MAEAIRNDSDCWGKGLQGVRALGESSLGARVRMRKNRQFRSAQTPKTAGNFRNHA